MEMVDGCERSVVNSDDLIGSIVAEAVGCVLMVGGATVVKPAVGPKKVALAVTITTETSTPLCGLLKS